MLPFRDHTLRITGMVISLTTCSLYFGWLFHVQRLRTIIAYMEFLNTLFVVGTTGEVLPVDFNKGRSLDQFGSGKAQDN